ncbi:MAG: AAA family ATPase [Methylococcaceae bacterium]|nr:AAA family ATPase [Methylococcaceae bacterium]
MFLKQLQVINFKSFQNVTIELNEGVNILTGVNNAGKTTMLEAISLWHECFANLIQEAKKTTKNYNKGDYVLGNTQNKYFPNTQINSVRSPHIHDIFYQCDKNNYIQLKATFSKQEQKSDFENIFSSIWDSHTSESFSVETPLPPDNEKELTISFNIKESGLNYVIELEGNTSYDYQQFNDFFKRLPNPIGIYYASPLSSLRQHELFFTKPQIENAILARESASVFRNRLHRIYLTHPFQGFLQDLSYILFDNQQQIEISTSSNINNDTHIIFNFKIGPRDVEKEIALLGSGALQIMEILLNLYAEGGYQKDMNLVLLDEPDSHIHRDIQQRLLTTLVKFSKNTQVILSTHNESLIRNAPLDYLFHLESKPVNHYKNLGSQDIGKQHAHFKGIYPTVTNPVISALGHSNGLDFVNAIEADRLVFVEGEDDARVFDLLLKKAVINNPKRYVYWVLGGVNNVFTQLHHYETVFSAIKNEKTLWAKSVLIFDRDYLDDRFCTDIKTRLNRKLPAHIWSSYTFEATLFTDLQKTARLLVEWLNTKNHQASFEDVYEALKSHYEAQGESLADSYSSKFYEDTSHQHKKVRDSLNTIFGKPQIDANDQQINTRIREHVKESLSQDLYHRLMKKEQVEVVIKEVVSNYGEQFDIETNFIELIQRVNKSTWLDEWDFLTQL